MGDSHRSGLDRMQGVNVQPMLNNTLSINIDSGRKGLCGKEKRHIQM